MDEVARALAPTTSLVWLWRVVVWLAAGWLLALGVLAFVRPSLVHRFIDGFVAAQRIDVVELGIRLIVSLALVAVSPTTKAPTLLFWFGAGLAITALPMMFLHRFQRRHAVRAAPFAKRILPAMGVSAIALFGLIMWATV